jgi:hypothetical protein
VVAGVHRPLEGDRHLAGEHVQLAADLRRQGGGEQAVDDQPAVLVGVGVDGLAVAGHLRERPDVLGGERPLVGVGVARRWWV